MNQDSDKPWTMDQFLRDFDNEDQDHVFISLREMYSYIQKIPYFAEIEKNGDIILPKVIDRILGDPSYLNNPTLLSIFDYFMKLIVPFSEKLPIRFIPLFYDMLFARLSSKGVRYFTALSSIIEDSISSAANYELERQKKIAEYMAPKLTTYVRQSPTPEMQNCALNLLTVTVENLSHCFTPGMIQELKELIESSTKQLCEIKDEKPKDYMTICESVATVSKVYATIIKDEDLTKFFDFIADEIRGKDEDLSLYILSTIIIYRPQYFNLEPQKDEKYSFNNYINLLLNKVYEVPQLEEYDDIYTGFTVRYLSAISVLVDRYGNQLAKETRDKCIDVDFNYINLGIVEQADDVEVAEDDAGFEIDGLEEEEEEQIETPPFISRDESWRMRVAAMKLGISLIEEMGEEYFDVLTTITDDYYNPNYLNNLIRDQDIGSKLEAANFFKVVLHHYKNQLEQNNEILEDWLYSVISQINIKEKDQVLVYFIDIISFALCELQAMPSLELSLTAIENITQVYRDNTIDKTLIFVSYLLEYSSQEEILGPIINLINIILEKARARMVSKCLTVASKIYYYYYRHCKKATSLHGELENLNEKVIEYTKRQGEVKPYAITTISVFVTCCPGLPTVQKSTDIIISFLDDKSVNRASTTSISLIAVSESSQTLSHDIKQVLEKLKNNLLLSDAVMTNLSLWAISLMLYKKVLDTKDCQNIIDILFNIANNGEKNARALSLKILNIIYPNGCDSKRLCSLAECLSSSNLSERIINEIAELAFSSAKSSLDNVKPFIDNLINKLGKDTKIKEAQIISNIAYVIGIASSVNKDYALSLVSSFKGDINNQGVSQEFALRCIGEIGSFIDLSQTNGDLIDNIFKLVHANDRSIFVPASESLGLMSVGSPESILKKLVNSAKTDSENYLIPWLFAINSFAKKVNLNKKHISNEVYSQIVKSIPEIAGFLLPNSKDDFKETALTVAECLGGLVGISFDFSQALIDQASYITIKAICIYMENYSSYSYRKTHKRNLNDKEKQELLSLVEKVDQKYDESKPMLDYSILQCLRFALTKNLAQELFDRNINERFVNATKILKSHSNVTAVGTIVKSDDIGKYLRLTAFSCLEILINSNVANQLNYDEVGTAVFNAILDEKEEHNILQKALDIITLLAKSSLSEAQESATYYNDESTIVDAFKNFENVCQNFPTEVMTSFYKALISILALPSLTSEEARKVKNILARRQADPILIKIQDEIKYIGEGTSNEVLFTNGCISSRIMEELYPDAASIFVNN